MVAVAANRCAVFTATGAGVNGFTCFSVVGAGFLSRGDFRLDFGFSPTEITLYFSKKYSFGHDRKWISVAITTFLTLKMYDNNRTIMFLLRSDGISTSEKANS